MNVKTTLSISEARKQLFTIAERVQKPGVYYTLTEHGHPKVVMLAAQELESLLETVDILHEPKMMKEIQDAKVAYRRKDYVSLDQLYVSRPHKNIRPKKSKKT